TRNRCSFACFIAAGHRRDDSQREVPLGNRSLERLHAAWLPEDRSSFYRTPCLSSSACDVCSRNRCSHTETLETDSAELSGEAFYRDTCFISGLGKARMTTPSSSIKQGICRRSVLKSIPLIAGTMISTNAVTQNLFAQTKLTHEAAKYR